MKKKIKLSKVKVKSFVTDDKMNKVKGGTGNQDLNQGFDDAWGPGNSDGPLAYCATAPFSPCR